MLQRARLFDLVQAGLLGINHGIDGAIARLSLLAIAFFTAAVAAEL